MKLTIKTAALVLSLTGMASAATISATAFVDVDFTTDPSDLSNQLNDSFTARVGIYSGGGLDPATASAADISASWSEIGSVAFGTGAAAGYNGYFVTGDLAFTDAGGFAGSNVWVWVTDGGLNNLLMQATGAGVGDFQFKSDGDIPNSGAVSIRQSTTGGWDLALGTFSAGGANAAYGGSYVLNAAVPEPGVAILGAFGVLGLLRRRRA